MFQDMQCELFFMPTRFNVSVDVVNSMIQVIPFEKSTDYDVDPTGVIKVQTFQQLWAFAAMDLTQLSSIVGRTFVTNVANIAQAHGSPVPINPELLNGATTDAIRYQGVAEAIESILDNSLLAFALTQILVANDTTSSSLQAIASAVRFGTPAYTYAVFGMAVLTTVMYLIELALTRCWVKVEAFDISNIKTSIISAPAGGKPIANAAGRFRNVSALGGSNGHTPDDVSSGIDTEDDGGSIRVFYEKLHERFAICLVQGKSRRLVLSTRSSSRRPLIASGQEDTELANLNAGGMSFSSPLRPWDGV